MKFSERVHPNLAMREKYLFEPPKVQDQKKSSFLWIHEKGNQFLKNRDYSSALQAYQEVLKLEKAHLPTIANISLIHLRESNHEKALFECNRFLQEFEIADPNTKALKKYMDIKVTILKRKVFLCLNLGQTSQALQDLKLLLELDP